MKKLITRSRSLVLVAVLAVMAAMCTVSTAQAASPGGGAGGIHTTSSRATAASGTPCSFVPALTCQSTDPTIALNIDYYGEQSGCTYAWNVDWGDGNSSAFTVAEPAVGYVFLANHTYKTAKAYTISVAGQVTSGTCVANPFTAQFTLLTPSPPPALAPTIYWSQTSGRPGTHVTLTGNGWVPGGIVQIHLPSKGFFTGKSSWHVNSNGTWKQNFTVADSAPGTYTLSFTETTGHLHVTGSFRVLSAPRPSACPDPSVSIAPSSGPVGSKFLVQGTGWASRGVVHITPPSGSKGIFYLAPATPTVGKGGNWRTEVTVGKSSVGSYTFTFTETGCKSDKLPFQVGVSSNTVKTFTQSVTVTTFGFNAACVNLKENPLGYVLYHTTYSGWSYVYANGAIGDGWYQTWDNGWKTVSGPATVVSKSTTTECGLPGG